MTVDSDQDPWDVVVVGAGPGGSAAALAALRQDPESRVLILDAADFPRDKSCGDAVAPHGLDVLAALGIVGIVDDYLPVNDLTMAMAAGPSVSRRMTRPIRVVPRAVLDVRLLRAAQARGANFRTHRVREMKVLPDRVVIDGSIEARAVVGADGAESVIRRQLGLKPNAPGHVAVAIRGYAPTTLDRALVVSASNEWPAYAWSFPIGDGTANIGYGELIRTKSLSRDALIDGIERLIPGSTVGAHQWRGHRLPLSTQRPTQPTGRVMLVGDAASLVNPMSGEGIYYALLSGMLAGTSARLGAGAGSAYKQALSAAMDDHIRATTLTVVAARSSRTVVKVGMAAAARSQRVFDTYIDVGVGGGRIPFPKPATALRMAADVLTHRDKRSRQQ